MPKSDRQLLVESGPDKPALPGQIPRPRTSFKLAGFHRTIPMPSRNPHEPSQEVPPLVNPGLSWKIQQQLFRTNDNFKKMIGMPFLQS